MAVFKKCGIYDVSRITAILTEIFDECGGISGIVPQNSRVLIKPNLLSPKSPEHQATTHPAIIDALCSLVKKQTSEIVIGDSPAIGNAHSVASACGIGAVARKHGIPVVDFRKSVRVKCPEGFAYKELELSSEALGADVILNVAKMKTHCQMTATLGVKNMFGCVVKGLKPQWHFRTGENYDQFAAMLVDVYEYLKPQFTIIDGIWAMEGQGPGNGTPKNAGYLIGGLSAHETDRIAAYIMGINPLDIPTLKIAHERKFTDCSVEPPDVENCAFVKPRLADIEFSRIPRIIRSFIKHAIVSFPVISHSHCKKCMKCADICPANAITRHKKVVIDYSKCIRCYCCHEICPFSAMDIRAGRLLRLYHFLFDRFVTRS